MEIQRYLVFPQINVQTTSFSLNFSKDYNIWHQFTIICLMRAMNGQQLYNISISTFSCQSNVDIITYVYVDNKPTKPNSITAASLTFKKIRETQRDGYEVRCLPQKHNQTPRSHIDNCWAVMTSHLSPQPWKIETKTENSWRQLTGYAHRSNNSWFKWDTMPTCRRKAFDWGRNLISTSGLYIQSHMYICVPAHVCTHANMHTHTSISFSLSHTHKLKKGGKERGMMEEGKSFWVSFSWGDEQGFFTLKFQQQSRKSSPPSPSWWTNRSTGVSYRKVVRATYQSHLPVFTPLKECHQLLTVYTSLGVDYIITFTSILMRQVSPFYFLF